MPDMVPHEIKAAEGVGRAPHDTAGKIVLTQITDKAKSPASRSCDLAGTD